MEREQVNDVIGIVNEIYCDKCDKVGTFCETCMVEKLKDKVRELESGAEGAETECESCRIDI